MNLVLAIEGTHLALPLVLSKQANASNFSRSAIIAHSNIPQGSKYTSVDGSKKVKPIHSKQYIPGKR
jgi:hypothetical protein